MPRDDARRFIERVDEDADFRRIMMEASEEMLRRAREHGFDFSREDLHHAMAERWSETKEFWRKPHVEFFCCLSKPPAF